MVGFGLAISIVSLLLSVLLLFGYASLLAIIRDLQGAVLDPERLTRRTLEFFVGDRLSLVLVTEDGCHGCLARTADLEELISASSGLKDDLAFHLFHLGSRVPGGQASQALWSVTTDAELIGSLGVGVLPSVLVYDRGGEELVRTIVGDRVSLERILEWARQQAAKQSVPAIPTT